MYGLLPCAAEHLSNSSERSVVPMFVEHVSNLETTLSNICGIPIEVENHTGGITIIKKMLFKTLSKYNPAGIVQESDSARILWTNFPAAGERGLPG